MSGNAVWPQAFGHQKLAKMCHFWSTFIHSNVKVARFARNVEWDFSVNFNQCDPRMEPSNKLRDILVNRQTKMQKAYRTLCTIKQSSFIISICSRRNQNVASCFYHHHRVLEAVNPGIAKEVHNLDSAKKNNRSTLFQSLHFSSKNSTLLNLIFWTHFTLFAKTQSI